MNVLLEWIILISILLVGLIGNSLGLIVFTRTRTKKLPSHIVYIALAIIDIAYLIFAISDELLTIQNVSLYELSDLSCRLNSFISYAVFPISNWLLSVISLGKYLAIQFPQTKLNKSIFTQIISIVLVSVYNLAFNSPVLFVNNSFKQNDSNNNTCIEKMKEKDILIETIQLVNSCILPFLVMLIFTLLLLCTIFKSRIRMLRLSNRVNQLKLKKDIQFAISSILINFIFFLMNFPACVYETLYPSDKTDLYTCLMCLFYSSFCIKFYILFFSNSVFRKQSLIALKFKQKYSVQSYPASSQTNRTNS
jgi:hypothetical protein